MNRTLMMPAMLESLECSPRYLQSLAVLAEVEARFSASPYLAVRSIVCNWWQGRFVLRGRVPTFHTKQVVLSIVRSVCPQEEILDLVEVAASDQICKLTPPPAGFRRRMPAMPR